MASIRFLSLQQPQLRLDGVPAQFIDGICDIDTSETLRLSRMRYLGPPAGVQEMGATQNVKPWTSEIQAARDRANHTGEQTADTISDFAEAVLALGGGGTGGTTSSATALTSGTLAPARIADGTLPLAKLAADVATQLELDAVVERQFALPPGGTDGQVLGLVAGAAGWLPGGGSAGVTVDGRAVDGLSLSSQLPTAEDLGAAPASVSDDLLLKADLDPVTKKVRADQLPTTSGGAGALSKLLIVRGSTEALADGYTDRRLFSEGTTVVGTGTTFAAPPDVRADPVTAAAITVSIRVSATDIDATGFTLHVRRSNTTLMSTTWTAIGVSA